MDIKNQQNEQKKTVFEYEAYLTLTVAKEFFEDSPVAFLKAECGLLPIPKPVIIVVNGDPRFRGDDTGRAGMTALH